MKIQINTDKTLIGDDQTQEYFKSQIEDALHKHQSHITRIEVHLKDEDGRKKGMNDISCAIEARLRGRKPTAIISQGNSMKQALTDVISKIEHEIESILERG